MKREISNRFFLAPQEALVVEDLMSPAWQKPSGAPEFSCKSKILFEQSISRDDNGAVWTVTLRAVTDDESVMQYAGSRMLVGIYLTDGSFIRVGNEEDAPVLDITPYETGLYSLSVSFKATRPYIL